MTKMMTVLSALFAASAIGLPSTAIAQDSNSVRVSYADLNLASDIGREVLLRRVDWAAKTACDIEDSRELALWSPTRECRRDAVARAQPAVDAAVAAARHGLVTVTDVAALVITNR